MGTADKTKQAMAILAKQQDGTFRLGDENDINIGFGIHLMLPDGGIVFSSNVEHYIVNQSANGKEIRIITRHSTYNIICTNARVQ